MPELKISLVVPPGVVTFPDFRTGADQMTEVDDYEQEHVEEYETTFGDWLKQEMEEQDVGIPDLVAKTNISYAGIWNIVNGKTISPRQETRDKLAKALKKKVPVKIQQQIDDNASEIPGLDWVDFTPSDLQTIPEEGGVYVFYDTTDRPVYVGMSKGNVRLRVKDHSTRFWFKDPLVVRGAFLSVPDADLCVKIEKILIKFLGKHALLNVKGTIKDLTD